MKKHLILATLVLFCACSKHGQTTNPYDSNVHPYFKDIIINEKLPSGSFASFQHALGYFPLKSDPNTQVMVASRGFQELNDARGFRIASINKTNGTVNWVKSYDLDDSYYIQLVTCAAIDNADNIWIGGHSFNGTGTAGILFLAKLDKSGNMIWSGSLSNYQGWRAYSLTALSNGDIAFFAKNVAGLAVLRLTTNEQPVWSTLISYVYSTIDNDYYGNNNNTLSPENHAMVETADGGIFVASSSNPSSSLQASTDRLYRLEANGNFTFAKIYTPANARTIRPVQLINVGADKLLMADQSAGVGGTGPYPFFDLLSLDGKIVASRGRPLDQSSFAGLSINEVNYYQNNIYFSSCGNYEFNTYVLDLNLHLTSAIKTVADNDIGTDRGGISLFDANDKALYYLCNFGGNFGESNGFEVTRSDAVGKPCITTYTIPPTTLLLQDMQVNVATDTTIKTAGAGPAPVFTTLPWRAYQVPVTATEAVCGQ